MSEHIHVHDGTSGNRLLRWIVRFVRRSSSIETLMAMLAIVIYPILLPAPILLTTAAAVLLVVSLLVLVTQNPGGYWTGKFVAERLVFVAASVATFAVDAEYVGMVGAMLTGVAAVAGGVVRGPITRLDRGVSAHLTQTTPFSDMHAASRIAHTIVGVAVVAVVAGVCFSLAVVPLVAGVVSVIVAVVLSVTTLVNTRRRRRAVRESVQALRELEPVFYLTWDAPSEGHHQVRMWLPYLKRIGLPFAIIVRTKTQLARLAEVVDAPVVYCPSMSDVDESIVPSLRTVFYVNTALRNAHYLRFNQLRHVQLNHGDSDKPASASKQFRAYDVNFVAGMAAVERFAHYGVELAPFQTRIVGRPQVENITAATVRAAATGAAGTEPMTVLYAPTWGGFFHDSDFSSLPAGERIVGALLKRGVRVIFRPHAFTDHDAQHAQSAERIRRMLADDEAARHAGHVFGERAERTMSIVDCFNASDAMIADVSSIVSDYLFSEKPLAMVAVGRTDEAFHTEFPVSAAAYVVNEGALNIDAVLDDMLGGDPLKARRRAMRDHYLGDFPRETYSDVFVQAAREQCL